MFSVRRQPVNLARCGPCGSRQFKIDTESLTGSYGHYLHFQHRDRWNNICTAQLHSLCNMPVYQRCDIVSKMIHEYGPKELHTFYPLLVESIFGYGGCYPGWYLARILIGQSFDFRAVRRLLSVDGPLLTAVYKLTSDVNCRYEFPISCLPYSTQCLIADGSVPEFYLDKLQRDPTGKPYTLLLDAFTFYMFHFCYFIVNPQNSKMSCWMGATDSLYPILLEDYLELFLPLGCPTLPPMIPPPVSSSSPSSSPNRSISHMSQTAEQFRLPGNIGSQAGGVYRTGYMSPMFNVTSTSVVNIDPSQCQRQNLSGGSGCATGLISAGLLGAGLINAGVGRAGHHQSPSPNTSFMMSTSHSPPSQSLSSPSCVSHKETWRSEVLLIVMVELWMNQVGSRNSECHPQVVCSGDCMRLVRSLVKHLHYFVNTLKTKHVSPYRTQQVSSSALAWDELKRLVWPHYVRKRLYAFLCYHFEWWPLDSTFRQVLETWLSFIQPWRYCDTTKSQDPESEATAFSDNLLKLDEDDEKWRRFIFDNILFYTVLFHKFLPRALRVDLCSSKNAFMLVRLLKTFNCRFLRQTIEDVEGLIQPTYDRSLPGASRPYYPDASYTGSAGGGFSPLRNQPEWSLTSNCGGSMRAAYNATQLTLQFNELEEPTFFYQPLFSPNMARLGSKLLKEIERAKRSAVHLSRQAVQKRPGFLQMLFGNGVDRNAAKYFSQNLDDLCDSNVDYEKTANYLDLAAENLSTFFQVPRPAIGISDADLGCSYTALTGRMLPEVEDTPNGPVLTPRGRQQILSRERKFDIVFCGDPDLQPIRSHEIAFLVRFFHAIAMLLNKKYSTEIQRLYNQTDFAGRIAQQMFQPPALIDDPSKLNTLSPGLRQRIESHDRYPRVSLRHLASYQAVIYFISFYFLLYVWYGIGPVAYVVLLLVLAVLYYALKARLTKPLLPVPLIEEDD